MHSYQCSQLIDLKGVSNRGTINACIESRRIKLGRDRKISCRLARWSKTFYTQNFLPAGIISTSEMKTCVVSALVSARFLSSLIGNEYPFVIREWTATRDGKYKSWITSSQYSTSRGNTHNPTEMGLQVIEKHALQTQTMRSQHDQACRYGKC